MSFKEKVDLLVHIKDFRNIDLNKQGFYKLELKIEII